MSSDVTCLFSESCKGHGAESDSGKHGIVTKIGIDATACACGITDLKLGIEVRVCCEELSERRREGVGLAEVQSHSSF